MGTIKIFKTLVDITTNYSHVSILADFFFSSIGSLYSQDSGIPKRDKINIGREEITVEAVSAGTAWAGIQQPAGGVRGHFSPSTGVGAELGCTGVLARPGGYRGPLAASATLR